MSRNVSNLDKKLVEKVEAMLKRGALQKNVAKRFNLDLRWVSAIRVAQRNRDRKANEELWKERALTEPNEDEVEDKVVDSADEDYQTKLKKVLRKAVPISKRVKAIKNLISSPNAQLVKAGLDQLNQIEGVSKTKDKPYEPGPLFVIDTIPDFRPLKRKDDAADEADQGGPDAGS